MDNLEYLNQISANTRPTKPQKDNPSPLNKNIIKFSLFGLIGIIIIAVIASVLSNSSNSEPAELSNIESLYLRINNLSSVSETYKPNIKNSSLRASSSSLNVILTNSKNNFYSILSTFYGIDASKLTIPSNLSDEFSELSSSLENAQLNGLLDRIYANEMAYQISRILILESSTIERTESEEVKSAINSSYSSLEKLKNDFSKFSETAIIAL